MSLTIVTNYHQRNLLTGYEIPESVWKSEFDYLGEYSEDNDNTVTPRFFRYHDSWYDVLDGFMPVSPEGEMAKNGWNVFQPDTFWSGVAIRWGKDWAGETDYATVVVARIGSLS